MSKWHESFLVQSVFVHTGNKHAVMKHAVVELRHSAGGSPFFLYLEKEAALALADAIHYGEGTVKNATVMSCSKAFDVAIVVSDGGNDTSCVVPVALQVCLIAALRTVAQELD